MSATLEASYQPLQPYPLESEEQEETPQDSGVMIHVVPENNRARWNHIEDLDSFFARMYHYHQKHGFTCMILQEVLELVQFIFVVVFSTFIFHCVDYSVLFKSSTTNKKVINKEKISLSDAVLPANQCLESFGAITWISLMVATIFWVLRAIKVAYHTFHFWDIKQFFNTALKVNDCELDNITWHEIQHRVREVQHEQQMCIHKADLTELDIYHRILRFKNYMVAMINKSLLPVRLRLPFIGEIVFFTRGLKYNLELLLFWGPWAPFENNWHLKEDYKKVAKRKDLAQQLSKHILWVGIANFVMCPLILLWQILYSFYNYAEVIKREPGLLSLRSWSLYGRLYLRHFNELDHELNARLSRAYKPATKYMSIFTSPITTVFAKNGCFICGGIFAVLVVLTLYDEDVLAVEHMLTLMTFLGCVVAACRGLLPDENLVWCPEQLMTGVIAQVHYCPEGWRGQAHTAEVRKEFSQMFHYKAVHLVEELISPIVTPIILCFLLRSRALDIVDFFRNFTVEVAGVGDVCSFALMDLRRHGNPDWQASVKSHLPHPDAGPHAQAEIGKTELSLMHFIHTNPHWKPPVDAQNFYEAFQNRAKNERNLLHCIGINEDNALRTSLHSMSSLGPAYNNLVQSIIHVGMPISIAGTTRMAESSAQTAPQFQPPFSSTAGPEPGGDRYSSIEITHAPSFRVGTSRMEGPLYAEKGLIYSLQQQVLPTASLGASVFGEGQDTDHEQMEKTAAEMSLSTLYLHILHERHLQQQGYQDPNVSHGTWNRQLDALAQVHATGSSSHHAETTPLLDAATKPPRNS